MLEPIVRVALIFVTAVGVVVAFALTPSRARGALSRVAESSPFASAVISPTTDVGVRRDPFGMPAKPQVVVQSADRIAPAAPAPSGIVPLPSNLANDAIPQVPQNDVAALSGRVDALVTGARPYAMIESGGTHEIKGLGDRIDGSPIVRIDIDGVTLANGAHLAVAPGAPR